MLGEQAIVLRNSLSHFLSSLINHLPCSGAMSLVADFLDILADQIHRPGSTVLLSEALADAVEASGQLFLTTLGDGTSIGSNLDSKITAAISKASTMNPFPCRQVFIHPKFVGLPVAFHVK